MHDDDVDEQLRREIDALDDADELREALARARQLERELVAAEARFERAAELFLQVVAARV